MMFVTGALTLKFEYSKRHKSQGKAFLMLAGEILPKELSSAIWASLDLAELAREIATGEIKQGNLRYYLSCHIINNNKNMSKKGHLRSVVSFITIAGSYLGADIEKQMEPTKCMICG